MFNIDGDANADIKCEQVLTLRLKNLLDLSLIDYIYCSNGPTNSDFLIDRKNEVSMCSVTLELAKLAN